MTVRVDAQAASDGFGQDELIDQLRNEYRNDFDSYTGRRVNAALARLEAAETALEMATGAVAQAQADIKTLRLVVPHGGEPERALARLAAFVGRAALAAGRGEHG